eukprot:UN2842
MSLQAAGLTRPSMRLVRDLAAVAARTLYPPTAWLPGRGGPAPPRRACKAHAGAHAARRTHTGSVPRRPRGPFQIRGARVRWRADLLWSHRPARPPRHGCHCGGRRSPTSRRATRGQSSGGAQAHARACNP